MILYNLPAINALEPGKIMLPIGIFFVPDSCEIVQAFSPLPSSLHNWWSPDLQLLIRM